MQASIGRCYMHYVGGLCVICMLDIKSLFGKQVFLSLAFALCNRSSTKSISIHDVKIKIRKSPGISLNETNAWTEV